MPINELAIVIPTRNRPDKLRICLEALQQARERIAFRIYVCDSSLDKTVQQNVKNVCDSFADCEFHAHNGKNVAAARNFCASVAREPILINVDDDVNVEPEAILALYKKYKSARGWRVVGGSIFLGSSWEGPVVMRPIGYGRTPKAGEQPSFLIGGLFLYPKRLAELAPWNERLRYSDDIFIGALWRSKNVKLLHAPEAKAIHNGKAGTYGANQYDSHIYALLFDSLVANRSFTMTLSYSTLGFAAAAKLYCRKWSTAREFLSAWIRGHQALARDWKWLIRLVQTRLPDSKVLEAL